MITIDIRNNLNECVEFTIEIEDSTIDLLMDKLAYAIATGVRTGTVSRTM